MYTFDISVLCTLSCMYTEGKCVHVHRQNTLYTEEKCVHVRTQSTLHTNKVVATFEKHIFLSQTDLARTGIISNSYNEMFEE
jgi:hypothetical protein